MCQAKNPRAVSSSAGSGRGFGAGSSGRSQQPSVEDDAAFAAALAAQQDEEEDYVDGDGTLVVNEPFELAPYIIPDELFTVCPKCDKAFTFSKRRHHCKCCGALVCDDCSKQRAKVRFPHLSDAVNEQERRVCRLCYDHQVAGDRHCFARYITILVEGAEERRMDRLMALRGIRELIEAIPASLEREASVTQATNGIRTMDMVENHGGVDVLFDVIAASQDEITEASALFASIAAAAASSSYDSSSSLSKASVCEALCKSSGGMSTLLRFMSRSATPTQASINIAKGLYLLGDIHEVQNAVRSAGLLPILCDAILASHEGLQLAATQAISRLVAGNGENVDAMLQSNGFQPLVLLLSSNNQELQLQASLAIAAALSLGETDPSGRGETRASSARQAVVNQGGVMVVVKLLESGNAQTARAGLKLLVLLSKGEAEVVRAAGAVPAVIALLASQDRECQGQAAELLRNISMTTGGIDVADAGGLSMAIPLLSSNDAQTQANAASLCEVFASLDQGANVILSSGGLPQLVNLVHAAKTRPTPASAPAAGALVALISAGDETKQAVLNAGGLEALMGLQSSSDPSLARPLVSALYSIVNDEQLLQSLLSRISSPTLAMKLVSMLGSSEAVPDGATMEMVLLVLAVLCGAKSDAENLAQVNGDEDVTDVDSSVMQAKELVASNGISMILPLLRPPIQGQEALILAVFRLMLTLCVSKSAAETIASRRGIEAVVNAMCDALAPGAQGYVPEELLLQIRLYGISLFGVLCGSGNHQTEDDRTSVRQGVRAIAKALEDARAGDGQVAKAAMRALKELSFHNANWDVLATDALPRLMEVLFVGEEATQPQGRQLEMLLDVAVIVTNLSKLERYCDAFLSSGGIFAMVGLISERNDDAIRAGILTLKALSESSVACRKAIVEQGAASKMLQVAERGDAVPALQCLVTLSKDQFCASKIAEEPGAVDMLLHLTRQEDKEVAALALEMLLLVAKDSEALWEELVLNADVDSALALLKMGPPRVKGQACIALAAVCAASPGHALSASPAVLEVLPSIVELLTPPEHLGADKSESPAKEAVAAATQLCENATALEQLKACGLYPALVQLLRRERRLGRPRSATSEHVVRCICVSSNTLGEFWEAVGSRAEVLDGLVQILDAHVRDTAGTESGFPPAQVAADCCNLLVAMPEEPGISPAEVSKVVRAARSLSMAVDMNEQGALRAAALKALLRFAEVPAFVAQVVGAGGIRAVGNVLKEFMETEDVVASATIHLDAVSFVAKVVSKPGGGELLDNALVGSSVIPGIAAMMTRAEKLEAEDDVIGICMQALSLLANAGVGVRRAIVQCETVVPALIGVLCATESSSSGVLTPQEQHLSATRALAHLAALHEPRLRIANDERDIISTLDVGSAIGEELRIATVELLSNLLPVASCEEGTRNRFLEEISDWIGTSPSVSAFKALSLLLQESSRDEHVELVQTLIREFPVATIKTLGAEERGYLLQAMLQTSGSCSGVENAQDSLVLWCSKILADKTILDGHSIALMILSNLVTSGSQQALVMGSIQQYRIVQIVKNLVVSGSTDPLTVFQAKRLFAIIGDGTRLDSVKPKPRLSPKLQVPVEPKPAPPLPKAPVETKPMRQESQVKTSSFPKPVTSPILPKYSSTITSRPPVDRGSGAMHRATLPQSRAVSQSMTSAERSSLELAQKLQQEEARRSGSVESRRGTGNAEWECAACTFHNRAANAKCEMCGGTSKRPVGGGNRPPPPSYSSVSPRSIYVRCNGKY